MLEVLNYKTEVALLLLLALCINALGFIVTVSLILTYICLVFIKNKITKRDKS